MSDAADLYQKVIMERGRHPRHRAPLDGADAVGHGDNPMCGDRVAVGLRFGADGAVQDAKFDAQGCMISLASADLMAELVPGHDPAGLRALYARVETMLRSGCCADHDEDVQSLMPLSGVHAYPSRIGCATLPWRALLAALEQGSRA